MTHYAQIYLCQKERLVKIRFTGKSLTLLGAILQDDARELPSCAQNLGYCEVEDVWKTARQIAEHNNYHIKVLS
jgi:hypothetical protein